MSLLTEAIDLTVKHHDYWARTDDEKTNHAFLESLGLDLDEFLAMVAMVAAQANVEQTLDELVGDLMLLGVTLGMKIEALRAADAVG